jgi:hypothetical protein
MIFRMKILSIDCLRHYQKILPLSTKLVPANKNHRHLEEKKLGREVLVAGETIKFERIKNSNPQS